MPRLRGAVQAERGQGRQRAEGGLRRDLPGPGQGGVGGRSGRAAAERPHFRRGPQQLGGVLRRHAHPELEGRQAAGDHRRGGHLEGHPPHGGGHGRGGSPGGGEQRGAAEEAGRDRGDEEDGWAGQEGEGGVRDDNRFQKGRGRRGAGGQVAEGPDAVQVRPDGQGAEQDGQGGEGEAEEGGC